jgi:enoyl-CoA hydratase/carnithine racemase
MIFAGSELEVGIRRWRRTTTLDGRRYNAPTQNLVIALLSTIESLNGRPDVGAIVITGRGLATFLAKKPPQFHVN